MRQSKPPGSWNRPSEVVVATKDGPTITASHLILATGYELMDIVPADKHQVISTWAIATKPQPSNIWPGAAFIWEASDPYLYMRATADGRVICGGEDEEFTDEDLRDGLLPQKSARIAEKLKMLFPELDTTPEFSWTGSFGTTTTGLPYMGVLPGHPRIFAVHGLWRQRHHLLADGLRDRIGRRSPALTTPTASCSPSAGRDWCARSPTLRERSPADRHGCRPGRNP